MGNNVIIIIVIIIVIIIDPNLFFFLMGTSHFTAPQGGWAVPVVHAAPDETLPAQPLRKNAPAGAVLWSPGERSQGAKGGPARWHGRGCHGDGWDRGRRLKGNWRVVFWHHGSILWLLQHVHRFFGGKSSHCIFHLHLKSLWW